MAWSQVQLAQVQGKETPPSCPGEARGSEATPCPALWAWGSRGGRKASLEAAVASGVQQLASSLLWGEAGVPGRRQPEKPGLLDEEAQTTA